MFVALRDLRFARGRFALMGAVVVLITVLVGLLSGLTAGLSRESTSAITGLRVDYLAFSTSADNTGASFSGSSFSAADKASWVDREGVEAVSPIGLSPGRATNAGRAATVTVVGVEPGSRVIAGGAGVSAGAVVMSEPAAKDLSLSVGDQVSISGRDFRVVAVDGDASFSHTPVAWIDIKDWHDLGTGGSTATVLGLETGARFETEHDGAAVLTPSESVQAIGSYTAENGSLQMIRGFLFAISALVIGAFFTVWTIQRSGDIAVLKALGASNAYLLRDALGQAVLLLVGGTGIGAGMPSCSVPSPVDRSPSSST